MARFNNDIRTREYFWSNWRYGFFLFFTWNYTEIEILCKGSVKVLFLFFFSFVFFLVFVFECIHKILFDFFFVFVYECDWKRTHVKRFIFVCKNSAYIHWLSNEITRKLRWNTLCQQKAVPSKVKMFYTFHSLTCVFISKEKQKTNEKNSLTINWNFLNQSRNWID